MNFGWSRRSFLAAVGAAGSILAGPRIAGGSIFGKKHKVAGAASKEGAQIVPIKSGLGSTGDIYAELGVTPLININGTLTVIGGSVMHPEVME